MLNQQRKGTILSLDSSQAAVRCQEGSYNLNISSLGQGYERAQVGSFVESTHNAKGDLLGARLIDANYYHSEEQTSNLPCENQTLKTTLPTRFSRHKRMASLPATTAVFLRFLELSFANAQFDKFKSILTNNSELQTLTSVMTPLYNDCSTTGLSNSLYQIYTSPGLADDLEKLLDQYKESLLPGRREYVSGFSNTYELQLEMAASLFDVMLEVISFNGSFDRVYYPLSSSEMVPVVTLYIANQEFSILYAYGFEYPMTLQTGVSLFLGEMSFKRNSLRDWMEVVDKVEPLLIIGQKYAYGYFQFQRLLLQGIYAVYSSNMQQQPISKLDTSSEIYYNKALGILKSLERLMANWNCCQCSKPAEATLPCSHSFCTEHLKERVVPGQDQNMYAWCCAQYPSEQAQINYWSLFTEGELQAKWQSQAVSYGS